jgi:proteasome assembly chaperone (PAC2) family protein
VGAMDGDRSPLEVEFWPQLKDPLFVAAFEGWNDGGSSATNAVKHLIKVFSAEKFAHIDPEEFFVFTENRPHVKLVNGRQRKIVWHTNDFFHGKLPETQRDVILMLGTEPHLKWRQFSRTVLDLVKKFDGHSVITLGGFLADALYTLPVQVSGFTNDDNIESRVKLTRTNYEGPTGIVGVMSSFAVQENLTTLSLWAAVPYYISIPNPKAVLALLTKLRDVYGFPLDLASLENEGNTFDNEINSIVAKDPQVAAYVRELKKRDFLN